MIAQRKPKLAVVATALFLFLCAWLACLADWAWANLLDSGALGYLRTGIVLVALPVAIGWAWWAHRKRPIVRAAVWSGCFILLWQSAVFAADWLVWDALRAYLSRGGLAGLFLIGLCWVVWAIDHISKRYESTRGNAAYQPRRDLQRDLVIVLLAATFFWPALLAWPRRRARPIRAIALVLIIVWLQAAVVFAGLWSDPSARLTIWRVGTALVWLGAGLVWASWQQLRRSKLRSVQSTKYGERGWVFDDDERYTWNPFDLGAWYYSRAGSKLQQSLGGLLGYTLAFAVAVMLLGQLSGCREIYEMPSGGGEQKALAVQTVKLQKVIKKKFIINPFSAIIFNPPPIDDVKLQLMEVTQHAYTVGYGQGAGAGFSGGTARGKVRFIRLEYAGGDWNQDFGVGADLNMLIQYGVRTSHPIHNQTESRTVAQLGNFVPGKSPPMVYLTGQRSISLSKSEIKILREYLLDQHGMLFGDNGGSQLFHNQFFALMRQALPNVEPVRVPLDDAIHRVPYPIPFLPYVAPHGGKDAWGWKVDGRWVCYYHPGDIADAWADDHSGVPPEIWEACYQLGTNVIFYAHVEYNKWLDARQQGSKQ